jgi:hypothetical protein
MPTIHRNNPCGTVSKVDTQSNMPPEKKRFSLPPRSVKKQFLINCEKRRAEEEGKEESEVKR